MILIIKGAIYNLDGFKCIEKLNNTILGVDNVVEETYRICLYYHGSNKSEYIYYGNSEATQDAVFNEIITALKDPTRKIIDISNYN